MHSKDAAKRIRRMWGEVADDRLPADVALAIGEKLTDEKVPPPSLAHKQAVLAAVNNVADKGSLPAVDRSFRRTLDQGTEQAGTGRLFDTIRPQLALLPWTFWLLASIMFVAGGLLLPLVDEVGARALVMTIPLLGLLGLFYTLRASSHGVQEWEQSCPVTPFQLALARIVLVLFVTVAASLVASVLLVRQDVGTSLAGLVVSWLAPLLLISGLYLAADVVVGGMAGSAVAAVAWFAHMLFTEGGRTATSMAASADGFTLAPLDGASLFIGVALLVSGLLLSSFKARDFHDHRTT